MLFVYKVFLLHPSTILSSKLVFCFSILNFKSSLNDFVFITFNFILITITVLNNLDCEICVTIPNRRPNIPQLIRFESTQQHQQTIPIYPPKQHFLYLVIKNTTNKTFDNKNNDSTEFTKG
jgi:hypothetical protein